MDKEKSYYFMENKSLPKEKQIRLAPGVFSPTQKANGQWIRAYHIFKLEFCSQLNIVRVEEQQNGGGMRGTSEKLCWISQLIKQL